MSDLQETRSHDFFDEETALLHEGQEKVKKFWEGFVEFAAQGNIIEIAFGLM